MVKAYNKKGSCFLVLKSNTYDSSSTRKFRTYDDSSYCDLSVLTEDKIEDASEENNDADDEDLLAMTRKL